MASSKEYLEFVLEQLAELDEITYRAMMGEYIIYYRGKIVGGIYDDRLLVKPIKSAISYMPTATYELPYDGAKEMLLVGEHVFRSRVEVDNYASQALHRKLGAVPNGMSEFLLHGEEIIKYQNENQHLIDDNIRKLAADFGVEPIEILGHVLEYKIEWK